MKKGFTLSEILIVIAIVALLALLVLANLKNQVAKAQDSTRKTDLNKIQKSLEEYYNDNQTYPTNLDVLKNCGGSSTELAPYLTSVPCDPTTQTPFIYIPNPVSAKEGYALCAKLDNQADPDITNIGCNPVTGCGYSDGYNYCLTSGMLAVKSGFDPRATATPSTMGTPTQTPTPASTPIITTVFACTPDGGCNSYSPQGYIDGGCQKEFSDCSQSVRDQCAAHPEYRCAR